jgi:GAF domain-containing protein
MVPTSPFAHQLGRCVARWFAHHSILERGGRGMSDQAALFRALAQYAKTVMHDYDIGDLLYQLTDHVVSVLDVSGAGVSIGGPDGRLRFVSATDERVVRLEEQQMHSAEGPCHDAYRTGEQVLVRDLNHMSQWPSYAPLAVKTGCQAVAGLPLRVGDVNIGALNVYADQPREWTGDDVEAAQLLADLATGYIVNAQRLHESRRLAEQLQLALDSRIVIEQAKGILAERRGVDPEQAFDILRGHARSHNRPLHDVAADIIDRTLRL